VTAPLPNVN